MNVTNKCLDENYFSSESTRNLSHTFKTPWIKNREKIFQELDVNFHYENNRAILTSQDANAEVERLTQQIQNQKNTQIFTNTKITDIKKNSQNKFEVQFTNNISEKKLKSSATPLPQGEAGRGIYDLIILATGGMYRIKDLGASDKIYNLPLSLDHKLTQDLSPSLSPLYIKPNPFKELSGISTQVTLTDTENPNINLTDQILLTHFGISGPGVLDFSALKKSPNFYINFLPHENLGKKIKKLKNGSHKIQEIFPKGFPKRLQNFLISKTLTANNIADLSKIQTQNLIDTIQKFEIKNATTAPYPACWTTKGGISLKDIQAHSLQSKLHKNLYFAGEILDINGLCGGYNITFAAISAKLISENILKKFS